MVYGNKGPQKVPTPNTKNKQPKAELMKPSLVLWLAFLMLVCVWIIAEPATAMAKAKKEQKKCVAALNKEDRHCVAKLCTYKVKP